MIILICFFVFAFGGKERENERESRKSRAVHTVFASFFSAISLKSSAKTAYVAVLMLPRWICDSYSFWNMQMLHVFVFVYDLATFFLFFYVYFAARIISFSLPIFHINFWRFFVLPFARG